MERSAAKKPATRVVQERKLIARFNKRIIERDFEGPKGDMQTFLLWGGKVNPVIILPVTSDKKIIAIKIFRHAANEYLIEIPGGNPETKETIKTCGRRELFEETGYEAGKIVRLGPPIWLDPCSCFTPFTPVLALGCQKTSKQNLDETEEIQIMLFKFSDWIKMIRSGKIRDSKTIATTFLALPYL